MIDDIIKNAEQKMAVTVEHTREDFAAIRTGRAHPAMFNKIMVDYYGAPTPLQQLATFQVPEARVVLISPFDRGAMKGIERAIRDSDLGVNPANDGNVIRLVMPQLTEERRKEYIKVTRHKAEEGKVAIRNVRRHAYDAIKKLEKDKEIGEDDAKGADKRLDALTKKYVDLIDVELKHKEAELLEV
jgi:ribosome recycling factor